MVAPPLAPLLSLCALQATQHPQGDLLQNMENPSFLITGTSDSFFSSSFEYSSDESPCHRLHRDNVPVFRLHSNDPDGKQRLLPSYDHLYGQRNVRDLTRAILCYRRQMY